MGIQFVLNQGTWKMNASYLPAPVDGISLQISSTISKQHPNFSRTQLRNLVFSVSASGLLNLTTPRRRDNIVSRSECQRHDGHGGLTTTGGHHTTPVAHEQIRHIVRAVEFVHH